MALAAALLDTAATSRLRILNLSENTELGDGAAIALGGVLAAQGRCGRVIPGLGSINFGDLSNVGAAGARGLAEGIRAAGPWLEAIDVDGTNFGPPESEMIKQAAADWREQGRGDGAPRRRPMRTPE